MDQEKLTELFRKLGAPDPETWARSQIDEGIDQLSRFVFLRAAWESVLPPADASWIAGLLKSAKARPEAPGADAGLALERMLAAGVDPKDIDEVARVMQYETLFGVCALLDEGPNAPEPELADFGWRLMRTDGSGECLGPIDAVHEDLLSLDPSGREMRPERGPQDPQE